MRLEPEDAGKTRIGERAVVIGASMAGLLAARALAECFERVTIVERDELPAVGEGRRAVPQGQHVHALLPRGQRCLEELIPGIGEELLADGAVPFEPLREMRFSIGGHELVRAPVGIGTSLVASRPLIEGHVRGRVLALRGVEVIERCDAVGLLSDLDGTRVLGARLLRRAGGSAEEHLRGDLVVAASGRSARVPAWLAELKFPRPAEERLGIDVGYASRYLRPRRGALGPDKLIIVGTPPGNARGLALFAQEGDRWLLTLGGYGAANRPPADPQAFLEFATTIAPPDVLEAIREAEPLDDIATYRFPANQRRRYERLDRFPEGLLVIGDAIASFNPLHGQGMTVAALEACALRDCLADGERSLARRFHRAAAAIVDHAWELAIGADLAVPEVDGMRPVRVRIANAYIDRVLRAGESDREVAAAFMRVSGMLEPPQRLLRPATALRVLRGSLRRAGAVGNDRRDLRELRATARIGGRAR